MRRSRVGALQGARFNRSQAAKALVRTSRRAPTTTKIEEDAATVECKIEGCDNRAPRRGPYAGRCEEHKHLPLPGTNGRRRKRKAAPKPAPVEIAPLAVGQSDDWRERAEAREEDDRRWSAERSALTTELHAATAQTADLRASLERERQERAEAHESDRRRWENERGALLADAQAAADRAVEAQGALERERQARIIMGQAETEISDKFSQAALTYQNNPVALHLRAMNMLYEAIKERGSMVIVPSSAVETMGLGGSLATASLGGMKANG